MKDAVYVLSENMQIERGVFEQIKKFDDLSNPKVLKSMNSTCKIVEVVTSPASPSPTQSSSSTVLKDTPRSSKEPSAETAGRVAYAEHDDVHSSAPTPCANSLILGKRPSRQRETNNKRRRGEWGHDSDDEDEKPPHTISTNPVEKLEKIAVPDNRHKGPCSYELCPNPTHSSGGGFKIVTQDTKAGQHAMAIRARTIPITAPSEAIAHKFCFTLLRFIYTAP